MSKTDDPWLLDTHIWIRFVNGDPALDYQPFIGGVEERSREKLLYLASISLWEMAMLSAKGRLTLTMPTEEWLKRALAIPGLTVVPLSPEIAADSCALPGVFHGDPANRLITASCRVENLCLITLDREILAYGEEGWVRAASPRAI